MILEHGIYEGSGFSWREVFAIAPRTFWPWRKVPEEVLWRVSRRSLLGDFPEDG